MSHIIKINGTLNRFRQSKEFSDLQFVARAVSMHDEIRTTFACIHSTGKEIVATNTRVLLRAESEALPEPGDYYVLKRTRTSIWLHNNGDESFPAWEKLLAPGWKDRQKLTLRLDSFSFDRSYYDLIRALPASGIRHEYISMLKGDDWTAHLPDPEQMGPVIFTSGNRMALVMTSHSD